jgi:membrane-bound lytic murein transglycosylase D
LDPTGNVARRFVLPGGRLPPTEVQPRPQPRPNRETNAPTPTPKTPETAPKPRPNPPQAQRTPENSNPAPETVRQAWVRKIELEPAPERAREYAARLRPVFLAQRAPAPLVWVAEVESGFDPNARSPAGAAGLYQLMPAVAKENGLSLWPRDERYQPEKNGRAAAQKLRRLHEEFHDWRLAMAAYNAGDGRVRRLLAQSGTKSYDAIARRLPAETQLYVPKIEATLRKRTGVPLDRMTAV